MEENRRVQFGKKIVNSDLVPQRSTRGAGGQWDGVGKGVCRGKKSGKRVGGRHRVVFWVLLRTDAVLKTMESDGG